MDGYSNANESDHSVTVEPFVNKIRGAKFMKNENNIFL